MGNPNCSACWVASSSRARGNWIGAHHISHAHPVDPRGVRAFGLGHVPEDRHKMGLINRFEAQEAFILGYHQEAAVQPGLVTKQGGDPGRLPAENDQSGCPPAPADPENGQLPAATSKSW